MKSFALDKNNDIIINNNQFTYVKDGEQLAQEGKISLSVNKGEWFLDEEMGFNMDSVRGKVNNFDEARQDVIEALVDLSEEVVVEDIQFIQNTKERKSNISLSLRRSEDDERIISEVSL